jgi:hypothetical protein
MQTILSLGNALNQGTARGKWIVNWSGIFAECTVIIKYTRVRSKIPCYQVSVYWIMDELDNLEACVREIDTLRSLIVSP